MDENRKELFLTLKNNAKEIKNILNSDELQLAKLDSLFRERNSIFVQLREILIADSIDEDEQELIQEMIEDNGVILDKMEKVKQNMKSEFNKKETEANKISKYSNKNLSG